MTLRGFLLIQENLARQGRQYDASQSTLSLALTPEMVSTFFEGHGTDDPFLDSFGRPTFFLTTSEEFLDVDPVGVAINGVSIGVVPLLGTSVGAHYALALDDVALDALRSSDSFVANNFTADIAFRFGSGSFRVATEWDFDLGELPHWGIGLTGPALGAVDVRVPAPNGRLLLLVSTEALLGARRGRRGRK
jgi:hypothetical protein